jgi:hypothetical protein
MRCTSDRPLHVRLGSRLFACPFWEWLKRTEMTISIGRREFLTTLGSPAALGEGVASNLAWLCAMELN